MDTTQLVVAGTGLFFLLLFFSGFWLSRSGKPYRALIFNSHKLIGLATGVLLAVIVYQSHQAIPLGLTEIAAIVVTVLIFVGIVAAGGLLSIARPMPTVVLRIHQIAPFLAVLAAAGTLYLLLSRA